MKFRLLLVLFLFSREVYAGDTINSIGPSGHHPENPAIYINGTVADYYSYNDLGSFWQGQVFVTSASQEGVEVDLVGYWLTCTIYIQPGDSVAVIDSPGELNRTFYVPDTVFEWNVSYTGGDGEEDRYYTIIVQYLSGPLEQYYLSHFDSLYIDSVQTAGKIQQLLNGRQMVLYPNPTSGLINLAGFYQNSGMVSVKVFDVTGIEIMAQSFEANGPQSNPIDMGNLPNGVYLVQYTVNGNRRTEKVIKM